MISKSKFLSVLLCAATALPVCAADDTKGTKGEDAPNIAPIRTWRLPLGQPRFALLCVHGLGLNSKSYEDFAQKMIRQGAVVYAIDVRGFGLWMQAEGHGKVDFDDCLKDIQTALQSIHRDNPGLPVFILGESMGGAIALRATSMYPDLMDGLISVVPAAERFKTKRTDLKVAVEMLKGPNHEFDIGKQIVDQAATAERYVDGKKVKVVNEQLAKDWSDDPLARMDLSPKELMQFQAFMNDNHDAVEKITSTPVLFMQGLDDQLVKPEGTWDLVQEVRTRDRALVAMPTRHLIFEEQQASDPKIARASTMLVLAWIMSHLPAKDEAVSASAAPAATAQVVAPQVANGRPTVIAFYNKLIDAQSTNVSDMVMKCQNQFGQRVQCLQLDINDPANQNLVKTFNVGAVPTLVFLKPDGCVSSQLIGEQANPIVVLTRVVTLVGKPDLPPALPPRILRKARRAGALSSPPTSP